MMMFEEIAVEMIAVIATVVALACLVTILAGVVLERRAVRALTTSRTVERHVVRVRGAERRPGATSAFTPSHT